MALVGNKADLEENRALSSKASIDFLINSPDLLPWDSIYLALQFIPLKDAMEYAEGNGMFFIETSAKTSNNINELFQVHNYAATTICSETVSRFNASITFSCLRKYIAYRTTNRELPTIKEQLISWAYILGKRRLG